MSSVLVAYATRSGSTHEAAVAVAAVLAEHGVPTRTELLRDVTDLIDCTGVVVGAPLFQGAWHMDAHAFLRAHRDALARVPVAVFALGPTRDPYDPAEWEQSRAQLAKALGRHPWLHPVDVAVFGGRYDPAHLRFATTATVAAMPASDIRDGAKVVAWAGGLAAALGAPTP